MVNFTMLVRNRLTLTRQALASLDAPGRVNLTVAILDDRSDEDMSKELAYWGDFSNVSVCRNDEQSGTGSLRNHVVKDSETIFGRGDYLYLSDNDVFFRASWLEKLIELYEASWEYGCRVLGAYNHPYHQHVEGLVSVGEYSSNVVNALATQSMLMRWEVWDQFGPFCQTPVDRVCMSEDVEFCNRITAAGLNVGVVWPPLIVSTGITNTFGEKIPGWELVKAQCPPEVVCE